MAPRVRDPLERFLEKTKRDPATGCLNWTKAKSKGYGRFTVRRGVIMGAHRWIFGHLHGYFPETVMHTCDNPPCVEISHLKAGTPATNRADCIAKGRQRFARKVSEEDAVKIRKAYSGGGVTQDALAEVYGVSRSCVGWIIRGRP